jgi:hypothetical protein
MQVLLHGVDRSVIALWLGHESIETTQTRRDAVEGLSAPPPDGRADAGPHKSRGGPRGDMLSCKKRGHVGSPHDG